MISDRAAVYLNLSPINLVQIIKQQQKKNSLKRYRTFNVERDTENLCAYCFILMYICAHTQTYLWNLVNCLAVYIGKVKS